MKSVFISSTNQDLLYHRAAVDKAIRRLDLRPINMDHFGSQPGGASGVSMREVGKADIFIGIVAMRYGYVPANHEKSVTEQEYDEAVKLGLPRLMYLLDPEYEDWPTEPPYVDQEPEKAALLEAFKKRIEQNEVRSLFTTPEHLAAEVAPDLIKLISNQQRVRLFTTILLAVVTILAVLGIVVASNPVVQQPEVGARITYEYYPDNGAQILTDPNGTRYILAPNGIWFTEPPAQ